MQDINIFVETHKPRKKVYNGYIMLEDKQVVRVDNSRIRILDYSNAPLDILRCKDLEHWCNSRCIDLSRAFSRVLRKVYNIRSSQAIDVVLKTKAVTITDRYWFKEDGDSSTYSDISFVSDYLADTAIKGHIIKVDNRISPELTNIGSFEKCWKREGNVWWLCKTGTKESFFSEIFVYELGKALGFNMAEYKYDIKSNIVKSKDFTNAGEKTLEHMASLLEDDVCPRRMLRQLMLIENSKELQRDYYNILFMDALCCNVDRHEYNLGLLRDSKTGRVLGMAPNYDNNLALISTRYYDVVPNIMVEDFHYVYENLKIPLPVITEELIDSTLFKVKSKYHFDVDYIRVKDYLLRSYNKIKSMCNTYK